MKGPPKPGEVVIQIQLSPKGRHMSWPPLTPREPAADHVGSDAAGQVAGAKCRASEVRRLAELVAPGEGKGVHDGQD
jgi:hypothetical protein